MSRRSGSERRELDPAVDDCICYKTTERHKFQLVFLAKSTLRQKFGYVKLKRKSGGSSSDASNYSSINGEKNSHR